MCTPLVLVVDDEAPIQRFVRAELEAQGYRVLTTGSGTDALERIEEDRPDLLLLDVMMPGRWTASRRYAACVSTRPCPSSC